VTYDVAGARRMPVDTGWLEREVVVDQRGGPRRHG